ncbi:DNA-formamidopyrimidine glycosylase family protein, partial [uncultured Nocardioides sp.]|uniref:DNA-formamidopyrimidine glycosylase family protein n=1 Tax=uncultured Nocardioides sp. TaxID=198441 RepID=UPI002608557D
MPEGHTLHRLAGELSTTFAGRAVRVTSPQGRFSEAAALLDGSVVTGAEAWGKHLFVAFDDDRFVHVHLGLYGTLLVHPVVEAVPAPVGQVRMRLEAGAPGAASYADPRGATT